MANEIERAAQREEREAELDHVIDAISAYAQALIENVKAENSTGEGRPPILKTRREERKRLRELLTIVLGRAPDADEMADAGPK